MPVDVEIAERTECGLDFLHLFDGVLVLLSQNRGEVGRSITQFFGVDAQAVGLFMIRKINLFLLAHQPLFHLFKFFDRCLLLLLVVQLDRFQELGCCGFRIEDAFGDGAARDQLMDAVLFG